MENYRFYLHYLVILILILFVIGSKYKLDNSKYITNSFQNKNCSRIPTINNKTICLGEDTGVKQTYYEASSYCSKKGMSLPTREDSWYIWISSENCQRAFASGSEIPKNKEQFIQSCKNSSFCRIPAAVLKKSYCNPNPSIKFPIAYQYHYGNFWLKESADNNEHFAINYSSGIISSYKDNTKLGVRCVKH